MLKNYFQTAIRNILRNRGFSLINLVGLALGMICFLFIWMYLQDELSYDRYHEKGDRTYRVHMDLKSGETHDISINSPRPLKFALQEDYPEVVHSFSFYRLWPLWVEYGEQKLLEKKMVFADPELFEVFSLEVIAGDPKTALLNPASVVLTESIAKKYFGDKNALGETLTINHNEPHEVTAIIKDISRHTHFDFNVFMSMPPQVKEDWLNNWGVNEFVNYVVLKEGASASDLEHKLSSRMDEWFPDVLLSGKPVPYAQFAEAGNYIRYPLMPLRDIHLHSQRKNEIRTNGDIQYVWMFAVIGFFILLLACVNFVNLTTANAANRAKEIGVRKVIGAKRKHLIMQFLGESSLITLLAFFLALLGIQILLPWFNQMAGKAIAFGEFFNMANSLLLLGLFVATALLAGLYPAFVLSAFRPARIFEGTRGIGRQSFRFRNALVVFQFLITLSLISGTLVVGQQLHFLQHQNLGYEPDQVFVMYDVAQAGDQLNTLQQKINQLPEVAQSTMTVFFPSESHEGQQIPFFIQEESGRSNNVLCQLWHVDENYLPTFDLKLLQGRNFSTDMGLEDNAVILNESAAQKFGLSDAVGKQVSFGNGEQQVDFNIVGVVKDFHFESFKYEVKPIILVYRHFNVHMAMKLSSTNYESSIEKVKETYASVVPHHPFLGEFLSERFADRYHTEIRLSQVVQTFTLLAIVIACMGLFGLATYLTRQRTKEIGIRKVLGASVSQLVGLLSVDFLRLVSLAILIAIPLSWYVMQSWLQNFAYHVDINWWLLGLAALAGIGLAFLTVSFQSIKAALANPIKALRNE